MGARFGTVTAKVCMAVRPAGSCAMTINPAIPCDMAIAVSESGRDRDGHDTPVGGLGTKGQRVTVRITEVRRQVDRGSVAPEQLQGRNGIGHDRWAVRYGHAEGL